MPEALTLSLSRHAQARCAERGITIAMLADTLRAPRFRARCKGGCGFLALTGLVTTATKRQWLTVILGNGQVVVTAFFGGNVAVGVHRESCTHGRDAGR